MFHAEIICRFLCPLSGKTRVSLICGPLDFERSFCRKMLGAFIGARKVVLCVKISLLAGDLVYKVEVTGGGHWWRSLVKVTGGGHWRSLVKVTGGDHWWRSLVGGCRPRCESILKFQLTCNTSKLIFNS